MNCPLLKAVLSAAVAESADTFLLTEELPLAAVCRCARPVAACDVHVLERPRKIESHETFGALFLGTKKNLEIKIKKYLQKSRFLEEKNSGCGNG